MSGADYLPERISLTALREAVQACRGCDLWENATQAVLGEGRKASRVVIVGEQPGDREDRQGKPFVGPAGRLLDRALVDAGIDRSKVYVTNAVKHFKWTPRGKKRLHSKPSVREVRACRPWLEAELQVVRPDAVVALGATAAQALFGTDFRVSRQRGQVFETEWAPVSLATVHPSSILRAPDDEARQLAYEQFVDDLGMLPLALESE
jgi:DNA polymerase